MISASVINPVTIEIVDCSLIACTKPREINGTQRGQIKGKYVVAAAVGMCLQGEHCSNKSE